MTVIALPLGAGQQIQFDTERITIGTSRTLAKQLTEVKKKHSPFTKYPLEVVKETGKPETIEQWQKRVLPLIMGPKQNLDRQDDEDDDKYLNRVLAIDIEDDLGLYFDVLRLIARTFDSESKVTTESLDGLNVEAAVNFIREVLAKARIKVDEVFPGRFEIFSTIK